jgi:hypothetical protein
MGFGIIGLAVIILAVIFGGKIYKKKRKYGDSTDKTS